MLAFLKPAPKQPKQDSDQADIPVESTPPQDVVSDHAEVRVSSSSVPTIDSLPTIHGPSPDPPRAQTPTQTHSVSLPASPEHVASLVPPSPANVDASVPSVQTRSSFESDAPIQTQSQSALPYSPPGANSTGKDPRRFSFPSFSFLRSDAKQSKTRPIPPPLQSQSTSVSNESGKKSKTSLLSVLIPGSAALSEKRAKECAAIVRSVIAGDHNTPAESKSTKTKPVSKYDIARVKSQLLNPKMAPKVISQLKALPLHPSDVAVNPNVPIHAVCLDMPDKDIHERYFSRFDSIATASVSTISTVLNDVHLVDLVTAPNMGFGAPATAEGIFAGAVPTAETVIEGIEQITPQLMALGYATGRTILPDHKGIIVPTDRLSVLTYWWGFELCLPPPTIAHLEAAESPATALLNLLTAISLLNEGVREILPFIRYIAQFVQSEWDSIKRADRGKGVVCTATWLVPVAIVPRPWDFTDPPPHAELSGAATQSTPISPSVRRFSATLATPKPSTEVAGGAPRSSSAFSAGIKDEEESCHAISSDPPILPEVVVSSPGSIDGAPPKGVKGVVYGKVQNEGEARAHRSVPVAI